MTSSLRFCTTMVVERQQAEGTGGTSGAHTIVPHKLYLDISNNAANGYSAVLHKALHLYRDHDQQNTDNRPVGRPEEKQSTARYRI